MSVFLVLFLVTQNPEFVKDLANKKISGHRYFSSSLLFFFVFVFSNAPPNAIKYSFSDDDDDEDDAPRAYI